MKSKNFGFLGNKTHLNNSVMSIADKVNASLISLVYSQTAFGLIGSLFCSTIILIGLHSSENKTTLGLWYGFVLVVTLLRSILSNLYKSRPNPDGDLMFWRNLFVIGAFFGGLTWGLAGTILFPYDNVNEQILILLVLAGTTAGAVPVLSGVLSAALAFIIAALLPVILTLLYHNWNLLFDATAAVYLLYLSALSSRTHATIKTAISLQFENITLLHNLSEAKNQLEIINKRLEQVATHDPLTNVANRNLFGTYFIEALERAKKNKRILALLYLDLDGFKAINDTQGHHIGDQLLLVLVDRLEDFFDNMDAVARLGGDEFAVVLENVVDPNEVAKIARRICHALAEPVTIDKLEIKVTASIGIAVYPLDGDSAEAMLKVADKAMYYVKQQGGNNFRFNVTLLAD
jgi:diguanylate cyclase (GGDEF)-like protein